MVIAIPNVLSSINDSRVSALHSKAKSLVSWYSETLLSQQLNNKEDIITSADRTKVASNTWQCLGTLSTNLRTAAEINGNDFIITLPSGGSVPNDSGVPGSIKTCSAIRTKNGKVEIVLVANTTGRFHVGGANVTYAYSSADKGATK